MFIVAGPPGAGKSSLFALSDFVRNVFNADDRAAQVNGGSYERIPLPVRGPKATSYGAEDVVQIGRLDHGARFTCSRASVH
jgi:hypothetical protein